MWAGNWQFVLQPAYPVRWLSGPIGDGRAGLYLAKDGLGAARGQRPRKRPCASYPTRLTLNCPPLSAIVFHSSIFGPLIQILGHLIDGLPGVSLRRRGHKRQKANGCHGENANRS